eukprot:3225235-Amphidinium_carterae.1
MKIAAEKWRQHSKKRKDVYDMQAAAVRVERERELEEEFAEVTGRLRIIADREVEEEFKDDRSTTMVFSNAALTDEDILRFHRTSELYKQNMASVMKKTMQQLGK